MVTTAPTQALFDGARALLLMVPANRPDRFAKAAQAGADAVMVDLEDAVPEADKDSARAGLPAALLGLNMPVPFLVRINGADSPWRERDVAALRGLPIAGVVLSKSEHVSDVERLSSMLGGKHRVVALIESALGLASVRSLACAAGRLAFGSFDLSADLGAAHTRDALLAARFEIVLASRLAGLPEPIDGATAAIDDAPAIESDAAHAAELGFFGKLLIHPRQVAPAARGLRPAADAISWAQRVMAAAPDALTVVDGAMVDRPVRLRAEWILRRAGLLQTQEQKRGTP
jgi:citrate lyase subunit beta/citryl-CoA lyase